MLYVLFNIMSDGVGGLTVVVEVGATVDVDFIVVLVGVVDIVEVVVDVVATVVDCVDCTPAVIGPVLCDAVVTPSFAVNVNWQFAVAIFGVYVNWLPIPDRVAPGQSLFDTHVINVYSCSSSCTCIDLNALRNSYSIDCEGSTVSDIDPTTATDAVFDVAVFEVPSVACSFNR